MKKVVLAILNSIVLNLIDSIALVDKVVQMTQLKGDRHYAKNLFCIYMALQLLAGSITLSLYVDLRA